MGAVRMAVKADSPPASAQLSADIRAAGMAAILAASGFAAAQRIARPKRLYLRKAASSTTAIGPKISMPE